MPPIPSIADEALRLPPEAASVPAARALVRRCLADWAADAVDAAELCMSELATNAVLHARTEFEAAVSLLADRARLQIRDRSTVLPHQVVHSDRASTGRGLDLVTMLAVDWGAEQTDDGGKVVWCELSAHPALAEPDEEALLAAWGDDADLERSEKPIGTAGRADDQRVALLLNYPLRLWVQEREHIGALLRECVLVHEAAARGGSTAPRQLVELADRIATRYPTVHNRADAQRTAAFRRGETTLDLEYPLPEGVAEVVRAMRAVLDALDAYAADSALLTMQTPPVLRRLRDWTVDELTAQAEGRAPRPWDGPLE
ncbi:ATP-binding protein [Motilibacter deserti]|uniref:ATP-binding protein n=1 Tax=Motilibacter deserti TaxID=2714956 RepID=A0ABX0GPQ2_9ACTN|nr:ATP-binding protein [Motilibacter deserti]